MSEPTPEIVASAGRLAIKRLGPDLHVIVDRETGDLDPPQQVPTSRSRAFYNLASRQPNRHLPGGILREEMYRKLRGGREEP